MTVSQVLSKIKNKIIYELNKLLSLQIVWFFKSYDSVYLDKMRIGNTTYIGYKDNLFIENNVFIGHHNFIDASKGLIINEGCQITNFVSVLTHSSHISIRLYGKEYIKQSNLEEYIKRSVYIGEYTFIGLHSAVMPVTKIAREYI